MHLCTSAHNRAQGGWVRRQVWAAQCKGVIDSQELYKRSKRRLASTGGFRRVSVGNTASVLTERPTLAVIAAYLPYRL